MITLLTGATGFIGAAVLRALVRRGHAVRVLVRPGSDRANLDGVACAVVEGSFADAATAREAVAGCDALVHVAADYRLWVPDPAAMYRVNVEGTRTLMEAAHDAGIGRIVYTGSVATLGMAADGTSATEETASRLDDMVGSYKRSKFLADREVRRMIVDRRLPAVIVQPSAPVGPRDRRPTPTGRMILDAARGRMPAYVDTGLNIVHVDDVAEGHCLALETGTIGESYVLGGENMTLRRILEIVAAHRGTAPPRLRLPHAALVPAAHVAEAIGRLTGGVPRMTVDAVRMARKKMYVSSAKAERQLGYIHRPASEAIGDAIDWYAANFYVGERGRPKP